MIIWLYLLGGLYLGYQLGRNNLGNLFGLAIGTRMIPFYLGAILASFFILFGALFSGEGTAQSVSQIADTKTLLDAFVVCSSAGVVLFLLTKMSMPVSIAQSIVGSCVGFNLFYGFALPKDDLKQMILAWSISPFLALGGAYLFFKLLQWVLKKYPIRILYRDQHVRFCLTGVGMFSAYALGANNVSAITTPYTKTLVLETPILTLLICLFIGIGFMFADKKVIQTVSKGLFPLSPLESSAVVFSSSAILFLFSSEKLRNILIFLYFPEIPLVPVSVSHAVIGAIVGVAIAKGSAGLKTKMLGSIISSWFLVPCLSGLICYSILFILSLGEKLIYV